MGGQEAFRHFDINLSFHFAGRIVKDYSIQIMNVNECNGKNIFMR